MAKQYLDFIGLNTFIYEPCGIEVSENSYERFKDGEGVYDTTLSNLSQNTIGHESLSLASEVDIIGAYKNYYREEELPTTASFFTALMIRRNGPYGYSTWRQIRSSENPLIRNQKKKNIFTMKTQKAIEAFREKPVSNNTKPFEVVTGLPGAGFHIVYELDLHNRYEYFENNRVNIEYAPYDFKYFPETDSLTKSTFYNIVNSFVGDQRYIFQFKYRGNLYPPTSSMSYEKRIRDEFSFPWSDLQSDRRFTKIPYNIGQEFFGYDELNLGGYGRAMEWPLDNSDFSFHSLYSLYRDNTAYRINPTSSDNAGILQLKTGYTHTSIRPSTEETGAKVTQVRPLYSFKHLISPLTSAVSPYGMDIEGVNSGSLYADLDINHLVTGEANWDAGWQYGTNPFYNDYELFVDDIKRKAKDYSIVPEFRSSLFFEDLQDKPSITPEGFLTIEGGYRSSSLDSDFFQVYSHSDFLKNFDIAYGFNGSNSENNFYGKSIKLTCKGIKKFIPYEGFYPVQRTVQIADLFTSAVFPNCKVSGAFSGELSGSDELANMYFNNIMTPMFGPGILYNSIKSGLAVDYPIHTSSLTIENGGIKLYDGDYYIQQHFSERLPFEALVEPNLYLAGKEIHCSNPHPSGNISGSIEYNAVGPTEEYQYAMHNFLAETANFFLKDQNFSFIASERSDLVNINLESGSMYGFNIRLYKSQNFASDKEETSNGSYPSFIMTGSGVQETFTMYSNPQSFGPPSRITSSRVPSIGEHTSSYSNLGYNWAFTPPYYDGISEVGFVFNCAETRDYGIQEIFNGGVFTEFRIRGLSGSSQMDSEFTENSQGSILLSKYASLGKLGELYHSSISEDVLRAGGVEAHIADITLPLSSLNISLGITQDVDLLDDDTSDTVKVAVDISSNQKSQIIIQPKWETPMFNFQHVSASESVTLPIIGSQSAPRGMWHQYGQIETDPKKGIFMQVFKADTNVLTNNFANDFTGKPIQDISEKLKFPKEPVKLGKTAQAKVIREAIVAVPFYAEKYDPNRPNVEERRVFFPITRDEIKAALENRTDLVNTSVKDMVDKMQRYVMPPMFNFAEDPNIEPKAMYIFEFTHVLDQEDLAAIWQNLPPKLMTSWEEQEVSVGHDLNFSHLLRTDKPDYNPLNGNIVRSGFDKKVTERLKEVKWMVFKVKQKAEQNYYNKIVGETQKLVKSSPYSYNWPYDYFSLVELAKIEADVTMQNAWDPRNPTGSAQPIPSQNVGIVEPVVSDIPVLTSPGQAPASLIPSGVPWALPRRAPFLPENITSNPTPQKDSVFDGPTPELNQNLTPALELQPAVQIKPEKAKFSSVEKLQPKIIKGIIK